MSTKSIGLPRLRFYDAWLNRAAFPQAIAIGIVAAMLFALVSARLAENYGTALVYSIIASTVLIRGGRSIDGPCKGWWSLYRSVTAGFAVGLVAFLCQFLIPERVCFGGPCGSVSLSQAPKFFIFFILIIAPVCETLVFQGWIQSRLSSAYGPLIGALVTAAGFIAIHFGLSATLVVTAIGLCVLRYLNGSLLAVAIAHALANLGVLLQAR